MLIYTDENVFELFNLGYLIKLRICIFYGPVIPLVGISPKKFLLEL